MPSANPTKPAAPTKPSNIFASPLKQVEQVKEKKRKKNHLIANAMWVATAVIVIVYSVGFLYPQMVQFLGFNSQIAELNQEIEDFEVTYADLQNQRDIQESNYRAAFEEQTGVMDKIFPENPEKRQVIQLMEEFAIKTNSKWPSFEFNSVTFQEPEEKTIVFTKGESQITRNYMVLPFQTNLSTTNPANFDLFLAFVRESGDRESAEELHYRLLDISKITVNEKERDRTGADQGIDFNVSMRAYFQKPATNQIPEAAPAEAAQNQQG